MKLDENKVHRALVWSKDLLQKNPSYDLHLLVQDAGYYLKLNRRERVALKADIDRFVEERCPA